MSSVFNWMRQTFGWSNSPRAWTERMAGLFLVGGFIWAIWFGSNLPAAHQLFVWAVLLLATAILLRHGWFTLFGPVLFYDMVRTARRSHLVWTRILYAGLLLFILATFFMDRPSFERFDRYQQGRLAGEFFNVFMIVQIIAVVLLTPSYVAGSIAEEKEKRTLEFLLATDLRNREIVLSKLGSRLANLVLFLLTGLPILSLMQFLGGVDPNLVLAGFAATGVTMASLAGVSICASTQCKRPRDAIAISYLLIVTYIIVSFLALGMKYWYPAQMPFELWSGFTVGDIVDGFNTGNLIILLADSRRVGPGVGDFIDALPIILRQYATFHGIVALALAAWGVARLRRVALRQAGGPARRRLHIIHLGNHPRVGNAPMLWKELHAEGAGKLNLVVVFVLVLLVGLSIFPFVRIFIDVFDNYYGQRGFWNSLARESNDTVRIVGTIVGCISLIAVAVRASTSISSERDRQTWDALMTTPMDSTPILLAKWLGSICSMRLAWIWLGVIWGIGIVTGGLHWFALLCVVAAWAIYAAFLATLGLWFSLICRSSMRATVLTILCTVGISVGHWLPWMCCAPLGFHDRSAEYVAKFQVGLTPPAALAFLHFWDGALRDAYRSRDEAELVGFSVFGLFLWAAATGILWSLLNMRFRIMTRRTSQFEPDDPRALRRPRPLRFEHWPEPLGRDRLHEPPGRASNAVLQEEVWDDPHDDDLPPRRPRP